MIQAPITKTGKIRYLEFIKIFVLVAFFIAITTSITEQDSAFIQINPLIPSFVLNSILVFTLFTAVIEDLKVIIILVKKVIITYIPTYYMILKQYIVEVTLQLISIIKRDLLQSKLCVIRC